MILINLIRTLRPNNNNDDKNDNSQDSVNDVVTFFLVTFTVIIIITVLSGTFWQNIVGQEPITWSLQPPYWAYVTAF